MTPETRHLPAHSFIGSRETIPASGIPDYFDRAYGRLAGLLAELGTFPAGPPRAYYFSPVADTVDLAGGFPLAPEQVALVEAAHPELVHHFPACTVLTVRHHGSYDTLHRTWQELVEAAPATGPVFWEEYLTEPSPEADPADMITDLYVTLA